MGADDGNKSVTGGGHTADVKPHGRQEEAVELVKFRLCQLIREYLDVIYGDGVSINLNVAEGGPC